MIKSVISAMLIMASSVSWAGDDPVSVGTDQACDYDNIEDALGAGNFLDIHVTTQKIFREHLLIGDINVSLKGGFADCTAAESGDPTNTKTTISGDLDDDDTGDGTVLQISGTGNITLTNFKITKGYYSNQSGGIAIDSFTGEVSIHQSIISDNYGQLGGGIGVHDSPDAQLMIGSSVLIINNHAVLSGGGLFCNDDSIIGMPQSAVNSGISNNTSNFNGGGIFLSNGCEMTFKTGRLVPGFLDFRGIAGNKANRNGGGVFLMSEARLNLLPEPGFTVNLSENVADADDSGHGYGGGAYITGALSTLSAENSRIVANEAIDGGGVYITDDGSLSFNSNASGCAEKGKCAYFSSNAATAKGGAIFVDNEGSANLLRALVEHNRADVATVMYVDDNAQASVHYSVFTRNGGNGNDGFNDFGIFHVHNDAHMEMVQSTVVDNYAEVGVILTDMTPFSLFLINSIIYDPSSGLAVDLTEQQEDDLFAWCVMFHEDSGLYGDDVIVDDPRFIDRAGRNFNLDHMTSLAIDECFENSNFDQDYNGADTGWDDPNIIASGGGFDIGAFESYGADIIFNNAFDD